MVWIFIGLLVLLIPAAVLFAVSRSFSFKQLPPAKDPSLFGMDFEEITFPTRRGKQLQGWWVPGDPSLPSLILVHGWARNRERMMDLLPVLKPAGYSFLLFDARSHGSSDPDGMSNMLKFSEDIRAAVDETLRRSGGGKKIGVIGHSVGGAATLHAAAADKRISCLVTIGAFANPERLMKRDFLRKGIPGPVSAILLWYISWRIGASFDEIAPENQLSRIQCPVFLIHGENDEIVPVEHGKELARRGGDQMQAWFIRDRGHSDCDRDENFNQRILEFLGNWGRLPE